MICCGASVRFLTSVRSDLFAQQGVLTFSHISQRWWGHFIFFFFVFVPARALLFCVLGPCERNEQWCITD